MRTVGVSYSQEKRNKINYKWLYLKLNVK